MRGTSGVRARNGDLPDDTEAGPSTKRAAILAAAERTFATEGYHGTTMRMIAADADVALSLIVYHFRTKLALYQAVFQNRQYVNDERRARLAAVTDLTAPDALDRIVAAFTDPVLALHDDPDGSWFARLVLHGASDPSPEHRTVITSLFDPMAREFIAALEGALPGRRPGYHQWAYLFCVGALTQSAFEDRMAGLSADTHREAKDEVLRSFITAGLRHG